MSISPQGYVYGGEPQAKNPFWDDTQPVEAYIKNIISTLVETDEGKTWTFTKTDNNDLVTNFAEIFVPSREDMPEMPTDYVTSITLTPTAIQGGTRYYVTYETADGAQTGAGTIFVPNATSVEVTGEETDGINTITIMVDGTDSSFDVPTQYVKSLEMTATGLVDTYTATDVSGETVTFEVPRYYVRTITRSVDPTTGTATDTATGVVDGTAVQATLGTTVLSHSGTSYSITITGNGDTMTMAWDTGGGGGGLDLPTGYHLELISGNVSYNISPAEGTKISTSKWGDVTITGLSVSTSGTIAPQLVLVPDAGGRVAVNISVRLSFSPDTDNPNITYHRISEEIQVNRLSSTGDRGFNGIDSQFQRNFYVDVYLNLSDGQVYESVPVPMVVSFSTYPQAVRL